jgi:hypothetical protein
MLCNKINKFYCQTLRNIDHIELNEILQLGLEDKLKHVNFY